MKIIYIGSFSSALSLIPLQALIASKHQISALAFDGIESDINVITSNTIQSLALSNSIPLVVLDKDYTGVQSQLSPYQADLIIVSCYSRKLPQSVLSIAKQGCLNIHPSLLPEFRGPVPLFWQFREGASDFGVTVHCVDKEFDTGNIVSQIKVDMQDAVTIAQATDFLAYTASDLILNTLNDIENICLVELPQNNLNASYYSFPVLDDYSVSRLWTAKRIYNFINAYKDNVVSFLCDVDGVSYKLIDAYSYQEDAYENMNGNTLLKEGGEIIFACQNSYIHCQYKEEI